jgi:hypothetical protein
MRLLGVKNEEFTYISLFSNYFMCEKLSRKKRDSLGTQWAKRNIRNAIQVQMQLIHIKIQHLKYYPLHRMAK